MNNDITGIFLHHIVYNDDGEPEFNIDGNIYYFLDRNIAYTHKNELYQVISISQNKIDDLKQFYAQYFLRHDISTKKWYIVTPLTKNNYDILPNYIKQIIHVKQLHSVNIDLDRLKYYMYINCTPEGEEHHKRNIRYMSYMNNYIHKKSLETDYYLTQ